MLCGVLYVQGSHQPDLVADMHGHQMYNASRDKFISAHQKKQQHASRGVEQSVSVLDVSQHKEQSMPVSQGVEQSPVYTHCIQAEEMSDFLIPQSQWIQQGPDGSIYISKEFLESLEPEVHVTVAVPSSLTSNSLLDGGYCQSEGSSVVTDNIDQYSDDELDYVAEEMSEEDTEQSQQDSQDEREDDNSTNEERGSRWKRAHPERWEKNVSKQMQLRLKKPKMSCRDCRFKGQEFLSDDDRTLLCKTYHNLESYDRRKDFLLASIDIHNVKRMRLRDNASNQKKKRDASITYYFNKNGVRTRVCKRFFTSTLAIGYSPITEGIKGRGEAGHFAGIDKRGKHRPGNKSKEDRLNIVRKHIDKFLRTL